MNSSPPITPDQVRRADARLAREAFAAELGLKPARWSGHNLSRMLRLTGERPERVIEMRSILCALGLGDRRWPCPGGVFDHGDMWMRDRIPSVIVGHPYGISDEQRALLRALARGYPGLRVAIDDRPSYYGFGTNHVRIELTEARRPWQVPPGTAKTRAFARAARRVFDEEFGPRPGGAIR